MKTNLSSLNDEFADLPIAEGSKVLLQRTDTHLSSPEDGGEAYSEEACQDLAVSNNCYNMLL